MADIVLENSSVFHEPSLPSGMVPASPLFRMAAQAFDLVALYILYIPALVVSQRLAGVSPGIAKCVWALVILGYYTIAVGAFGSTIGKVLFGMRVVQYRTPDIPNYWQAFKRAVAWIMLTLFAFVGYLTVLGDRKEWRGANDRFAGTAVIRTPMTA